ADRLVAGRGLPHIRRGVDHRMAAQVEARLAAAVEHVDLRRVANAEQRSIDREGVLYPELADIGLRDRHGKNVMRHQPLPSSAFLRSSCTGLSPIQMRSSAR